MADNWTPANGARGADESRVDALERALRLEIAAGKRAVGSLLPTETELCEQTGLSRYAVRKVIGKLTELGLVSRQQGIGTTVLAAQPQPRYVQSMASIEDLLQYASGTEFNVDDKRFIHAKDGECDLLQCAPGEKWLKLAGVRCSAGEHRVPISLVSIYVAARYGDLQGMTTSPKTPVYSLIERSYGVRITKVQQDIRGILIAGESAAALKVSDGAAGLFIIRRYYIGAELVEVTTGLHPADRFVYSMAFQLAAK
ncbi:MAG TPA: GntR family transcriptional regulator [Ramlibacter sp.]|nr:GntR family transcriptional regulator [Ramlibacter sp.]